MESKFPSVLHVESLKARKLIGSRCRTCGRRFLPARPICPDCRTRDMEPVEFKGKGRLVAFTVICVPPPMMLEEGYSREKPYCCGVVELEEGVRVAARITGVDVSNPDRIKIGVPVEVEFVSHLQGKEERVFLAFKAAD